MGKTRDHFNKIIDTKGTSHAKIGTIKDENGMDLTVAEGKKTWQEYTEKLQKDLHDPDNHDDVNTHLEPNILEFEAKGTLGSIRQSLPQPCIPQTGMQIPWKAQWLGARV